MKYSIKLISLIVSLVALVATLMVLLIFFGDVLRERIDGLGRRLRKHAWGLFECRGKDWDESYEDDESEESDETEGYVGELEATSERTKEEPSTTEPQENEGAADSVPPLWT